MNKINDHKYSSEDNQEEFRSLKNEMSSLGMNLLGILLIFQVVKDYYTPEFVKVYLSCVLLFILYSWVRLIRAGFFKSIRQDIRHLQNKIAKWKATKNI